MIPETIDQWVGVIIGLFIGGDVVGDHSAQAPCVKVGRRVIMEAPMSIPASAVSCMTQMDH